MTARVTAATAVRFGLAAVLAYAAVRTVGDPAATVRAVEAYRLLPDGPARGVGYGLPFLELALAGLLLAGLAVRAAAVASAVLFALVLAGLVSAAARDLRVGSGWFGTGTPYLLQIGLAALLLGLAVLLAVWPRTRYALEDRLRAAAAAQVAPVRGGPRRGAEARRRGEELERQRAAAGERRVRRAGALAGVALVAVTGAGIGLQAARTPGSRGPDPQAVTDAGGITVGRSSARVTIEVYEDPLCPTCATFEREAGAQLDVWERAGTAQVRHYVLATLDSRTSTRYSTRAANALYCSADAGAFPRYHDLLFANQPPDGSAGLSDDQLVAYGEQAGIGGAELETFRRCVTDRRRGDLVSRVTQQASRDGVLGTPTVLLDGRPVQPVSLAELTEAVNAAT